MRAVLHYRLGDVEAPAADGTSLHALRVEKRGALDAALADVAVLGALAARGWTQCGLQALVWGVPTKLQNSLSRPIPSRFG